MSSVAKCLVLAGVALEADALLLQTGTTECNKKGCSGSEGDKGNNICALFTKVRDMDDKAKNGLADDKVTVGTKADTVKFDGIEYTCKEEQCAQEKGKDEKKLTKPSDVDTKLGNSKNLVNTACTKKPAPAGGEAQSMCDAIKFVSGAAEHAITSVKKDDGAKTVTMKTADGDKKFKCEAGQGEQCNVADGTDSGTKAAPTTANVDTAAGTKKSYKDTVTATAFADECNKS